MNNNSFSRDTFSDEDFSDNYSGELSPIERKLLWVAGEEASPFGKLVCYETGLGPLGRSILTMAGLGYEGRTFGWRRYPLGMAMSGEGAFRIMVGGLELFAIASGVIGYSLGADTQFLRDVAADIAVLEAVKAGVAMSRRALTGAMIGGWRGAVRYLTQPVSHYLKKLKR